jgi:plastocyanin
MHMPRHWALISALAIIVMGASALLAEHAVAQATGPVVLVGAGEPGYSVNLFGVNAVTVSQGTTVTFRGNWIEPHTVTFVPAGQQPPPPGSPSESVPTHPGQVPSITGSQLVNSGFVIQNAPAGAPVFAQFQASFPNTGSFPLLCLLHPGMTVNVNVVAAGSTGISVQSQLDSSAQTTFASTLTALKAEAARIAATPVAQTKNADGSTTWNAITVGGQVPPSNDVQQFLPRNLNIQAGDTVLWRQTALAPHTVTFGVQPGGPPLTSLDDPRIAPKPAPATGYDGSGTVNSGIMFGPGVPLPFPAPSSFSVKFTKAGTYTYICLLHVDQGMGGTITVAAQTAPSPPKTGSAGLAGPLSEVTPGSTLTMLGILAAAVLIAGRVLSRRAP